MYQKAVKNIEKKINIYLIYDLTWFDEKSF